MSNIRIETVMVRHYSRRIVLMSTKEKIVMCFFIFLCVTAMASSLMLSTYDSSKNLDGRWCTEGHKIYSPDGKSLSCKKITE